jgi:hypothetical protein
MKMSDAVGKQTIKVEQAPVSVFPLHTAFCGGSLHRSVWCRSLIHYHSGKMPVLANSLNGDYPEASPFPIAF